MAPSVFVDTAYFVALLDPRDHLNSRATALAQELADERAAMLTSDAVLLEFANYFARSPLRTFAVKWIAALRADSAWAIEPVQRDLLLRAESRYALHGDKTWSLTDCHSMEVMRQRRIRDVATTDIGFEQAGFRCLLR
ncbi:MAG: type II toxin-antitoxin system VapC family toxin [Deltaproteobacteria bacterium]